MQSTMLQSVLLLSIVTSLCQYPPTTEARSASYPSGLLYHILASRFDDVVATNNHLVRAEASTSIDNVKLKENDKVLFRFTSPKEGTVYLHFLKDKGDTKSIPMYIAIHYTPHPHYVQLDCYEMANGDLSL